MNHYTDDYEEPGELVGEDLANAIAAMHEFNAVYAVWIDSGCMCGCGRPITLQDALDAPHLCPTCFDELLKSCRSYDETEVEP